MRETEVGYCVAFFIILSVIFFVTLVWPAKLITVDVTVPCTLVAGYAGMLDIPGRSSGLVGPGRIFYGQHCPPPGGRVEVGWTPGYVWDEWILEVPGFPTLRTLGSGRLTAVRLDLALVIPLDHTRKRTNPGKT